MSIKGINDGIKNWIGGMYNFSGSGEGQPSPISNISYLLLLYFYWRIFWKKKS
jgi:hypothetical protein